MYSMIRQLIHVLCNLHPPFIIEIEADKWMHIIVPGREKRKKGRFNKTFQNRNSIAKDMEKKTVSTK
jgi:hypothetical protein